MVDTYNISLYYIYLPYNITVYYIPLANAWMIEPNQRTKELELKDTTE